MQKARDMGTELWGKGKAHFSFFSRLMPCTCFKITQIHSLFGNLAGYQQKGWVNKLSDSSFLEFYCLLFLYQHAVQAGIQQQNVYSRVASELAYIQLHPFPPSPKGGETLGQGCIYTQANSREGWEETTTLVCGCGFMNEKNHIW